jgi:hypothetical protein
VAVIARLAIADMFGVRFDSLVDEALLFGRSRDRLFKRLDDLDGAGVMVALPAVEVMSPAVASTNKVLAPKRAIKAATRMPLRLCEGS